MAKTERQREWWELSQEELDANEEAQLAKQSAYFNTFYASDEGRAVLYDILCYCNAQRRSAEALLALTSLYHHIRASSGIDDKEAIDAEAKTI
jgi:hypothetical protein